MTASKGADLSAMFAGIRRTETVTDATVITTTDWGNPIGDGDRRPDLSTKPQLLKSMNIFPHKKQVGAYLVGRTIGEGSFAKVKEGVHILTGEKVAIKVIDKHKARADRYVRRNMRREARLLRRIRHCNVVQLLDVMETGNGFYLVMEYCGGGDLMTKIYDSHTIDEADARLYVRQIVSAVDYLHRAGILHRDLKVENLLLNEKGKVKIIDFGLSNVVRRGVSAACGSRSSRSVPDTEITDVYQRTALLTTRQTTVIVTPATSNRGSGDDTMEELCTTQCGSPAYAAPELLSGEKYGPKVDVWSIGVNMFAMLTGNLPFTVEPFSVRGLLSKMMNGRMNELPSHLTKNCQDLLKRFLTANPDRRISLYQAMHHPWLAEGRNKPMEPAPFPNRLTEMALCRPVLEYMTDRLGYRQADVIRLVTENVPSGATATYHLLLRRLQTTNRHDGKAPLMDGGERSNTSARRRCSDGANERLAVTFEKTTAHVDICGDNTDKQSLRNRQHHQQQQLQQQQQQHGEDDNDLMIKLLDVLSTSASNRIMSLPPLTSQRRAGFVTQTDNTRIPDAEQRTATLVGSGLAAVAEDETIGTWQREEHDKTGETPTVTTAGHPNVADAVDSGRVSVIDRTDNDHPKAKRRLLQTHVLLGEQHDTSPQQQQQQRGKALLSRSIGIPTAMSDDGLEEQRKSEIFAQPPQPASDRYVTGLNFREPVSANGGKPSTSEDGGTVSFNNRSEVIGSVESSKRLLGRRRLLQPVPRINLRPLVDVIRAKSCDGNVSHTAQKHNGFRSFPKQPLRASRPSGFHVVELRFGDDRAVSPRDTP